MSQSPVSSDEFDIARQEDSDYRRRLRELNQRLRHNGTLSGHERNCAFLNLQGTDFATVSAVSGFDFDDDARGLAVVDWDGDGDLDLWTTSRTGPRLRFLRNELTDNHHFLLLRLEGVRCNRDAIGAKVIVALADRPNEKLMKSLRAGEGFLSQGSKWLHFGLGDSDNIKSVTVLWPDGSRQSFSNLAADGRYRIVQDQPEAIRIDAAGEFPRIQQLPQTQTKDIQAARIPLLHRIPVPNLPIQSLNSDPQGGTIVPGSSGPQLINLVATWCPACREEMAIWSQHHEGLKATGLDIHCIIVDEMIDSPTSPTADDATLAAFPTHRATAELSQRLQDVHQIPFTPHVAMPVPTSFLVDATGHLAVIYRGPVAVDTLLEDIAKLALNETEWQLETKVHPGRWNQVPSEPDFLTLARELVNRGAYLDAVEYTTRFEDKFARSNEFSKLLTWLADSLIQQNPTVAVAEYRRALRMNPNDVTAMNNFAWQLATDPRTEVRDGDLAVQLAEKAARLTKLEDYGVLDTLGAAYASIKNFKRATAAAKRGITLAEAQGADPALIGRMQSRLKRYREASQNSDNR